MLKGKAAAHCSWMKAEKNDVCYSSSLKATMVKQSLQKYFQCFKKYFKINFYKQNFCSMWKHI